LSDRNAKENLRPVNGRVVLEKVSALPLATWNYKTQNTAVRHIGPMAQDFAAAFGVGENDKTITTVDADGVALAAIQGLNQKLVEELQRRDAENTELKSRLSALEELVAKLKGN
jgi:trimeric autotransporter adhesin